MSRILLYVENRENRRLMAEWLEQYHDVVVATDGRDFETVFDCGIVDGVSLIRCTDDITRVRDACRPCFLPFLLITTRQDVRLVQRHLWRTIDELIFSPIEKVELQARIEILLRGRTLSLEMNAANQQLAALVKSESEARQQAEEADKTKLRFLAMVSHELRTPLASIKGFSSSLLADDIVLEPAVQQDFMRIIDEEADKLTALVSQLLDLSRLQAGTIRIHPAAHSVTEVMQKAQAQLDVLASNHALVVDLPPELPTLQVDLDCATQILTNLVGNAAKYSPPQSLINISAVARDNFVEFTVSDQGVGISLEEREGIFEAFRQLDRKGYGASSGAGLGLAICKGFVEAHGGTIWIADRQPPGTTIAFTLPTT